MNNGICPKCKAREVYRGPSTDGEGLSAGSYASIIEIMAGKTQTTLWVDTYICHECGYVEIYVANRADLDVLACAENWSKVAELETQEEIAC